MLLRNEIDVVEERRRLVMRAAFGLVIVGIGVLVFVIVFIEAVKVFFIVLSCLYVVVGGIVMFGVCRKNRMSIRIGHKLYFLILLNFVAGFLLGFSAIESRLYPRTIEDEGKAIKDREKFFHFVFLISSSITSFSGIYLLLKIAKLLRNYSMQENSFEMEKI